MGRHLASSVPAGLTHGWVIASPQVETYG